MELLKLLRRTRQLPVVRPFLESRYERFFREAQGMQLFRGVYSSYEEASRSAPEVRGVGYDQAEPAQMYRDRLDVVFHTDYPVLYWLSKLSSDVQKIFDFGGHVGVKYYAYKKYIHHPEGFSWIVSDVPAVVEAGRQLATERGAANLSFVGDILECSGVDLLLCTGSLQYVPWALGEKLEQVEIKPRHIIVNATPIGDGPTFFTLNSIGVAFCPYRVANRDEFVGEIVEHGYELVDEWENPGKDMQIPFHDDISLNKYRGFYFRRCPAP